MKFSQFVVAACVYSTSLVSAAPVLVSDTSALGSGGDYENLVRRGPPGKRRKTTTDLRSLPDFTPGTSPSPRPSSPTPRVGENIKWLDDRQNSSPGRSHSRSPTTILKGERNSKWFDDSYKSSYKSSSRGSIPRLPSPDLKERPSRPPTRSKSSEGLKNLSQSDGFTWGLSKRQHHIPQTSTEDVRLPAKNPHRPPVAPNLPNTGSGAYMRHDVNEPHVWRQPSRTFRDVDPPGSGLDGGSRNHPGPYPSPYGHNSAPSRSALFPFGRSMPYLGNFNAYGDDRSQERVHSTSGLPIAFPSDTAESVPISPQPSVVHPRPRVARRPLPFYSQSTEQLNLAAGLEAVHIASPRMEPMGMGSPHYGSAPGNSMPFPQRHGTAPIPIGSRTEPSPPPIAPSSWGSTLSHYRDSGDQFSSEPSEFRGRQMDPHVVRYPFPGSPSSTTDSPGAVSQRRRIATRVAVAEIPGPLLRSRQSNSPGAEGSWAGTQRHSARTPQELLSYSVGAR